VRGTWAFLASIALLALASAGQPAGLAAERWVRSSARDLPVSARVDILVVGGNEGGLAAAWTAARAGSTVLVVTGNYFFSDDVSAKARYWLEPDEVPQGEFSRALFAERSGGRATLTPAQYKRDIEDLLLDAGVAFHFNSKPTGVLVDGAGHVAGVVTANKAGLQAVIAKVVIDTTPTGTVARLAGAVTTPWSVQQVQVSRVSYGARVPGGRQIGEFCEYALDAPMPDGSWPQRCRAEVLLREKHDRVDGKRAHAQCLHMIEPVCLRTEAYEAADRWPGADQLDLGCCLPAGVPYVYVLGQAAGVSRSIAEQLTRPVPLADLGERIGRRAHQQAAARVWVTGGLTPARSPGGTGGLTPDRSPGGTGGLTPARSPGAQAAARDWPSDLAVRPDAAAVADAEADVSDLLTGHRRYVRSSLGTVPQPELAIPVWGAYDVVVVGGGTSGIPAALAAARQGAKVLIVEMLGQLGGNRELGTPGYWKGYPYGFNQWKWRAVEAFAELRQADVDIWYNTLACGAVKQADRVCGVVLATHLGRGAVLGQVVIDATGDADVCAAAGAGFAYVNDGDLCLQEASFRDVDLYANVLPLDHADVHSLTMHHVLARKAGKQDVWDYYPLVGLRETRLVRGDHVIDVIDQILGRTYRDLISVSWSAYDPHGYHNSDLVYAGLMPPTKHETKPGFATYIPLRSLLPQGLDGLLVVGRCLSVTHDVQASVRMNADLINLGYAAGYTAAHAIRSGATLRTVELGPIQDHLAEIGNISREDRLQRCVDSPEPTDAELRAALDDLESKPQLAMLLRGGRRSLPGLRAAFASAPTLAKAKALCVLGDAAAVEYLAAWLDSQPLGAGTAYQWDAFLAVPDVESVMWLLGVPRDERAVAALVRKLQQCGTGGTSFSHLRAVTSGLGRIGSPAAAAALADFLRRPGVQGHVDVRGDPQSLRSDQFVKSYIELFAAGALVRCGDCDGLGRAILNAYLEDWRGIFVRYAGHVLAEGTGSGGEK
jgi:NADPH-dependent 2,4-dienoyl-CoA reductase/sulfur reductase-like enzyme